VGFAYPDEGAKTTFPETVSQQAGNGPGADKLSLMKEPVAGGFGSNSSKTFTLEQKRLPKIRDVRGQLRRNRPLGEQLVKNLYFADQRFPQNPRPVQGVSRFCGTVAPQQVGKLLELLGLSFPVAPQQVPATPLQATL